MRQSLQLHSQTTSEGGASTSKRTAPQWHPPLCTRISPEPGPGGVSHGLIDVVSAHSQSAAGGGFKRAPPARGALLGGLLSAVSGTAPMDGAQ